MSYLIERS